jgi:outer membrane autotransporter protein
MSWPFCAPVVADALRRSMKHVSVSNSWLRRDGGLVLLVGVWLGTVAAHAQNASWLLSPGSRDWNTAANWALATVPTGIATFGASNRKTITLSNNASVGTLQFDAGAPAYSFNLSGLSLTITGAGIVNNSSNLPTFSTGGTSILIFQTVSTAANATITTNSGGKTDFFNTSTGDQARFITNAGGTMDISGLTSGGMTAGSIKGAGTYRLGSKALTIGLNNLSTEVSGTINDGGILGGMGGALIKVGTGTLTLSGTNTYSGGTNLNGGILAVNGDGNLGIGPLSFNGGTLRALAAGGGIASSKAVTLNAGGGTFWADAGTTSTLSGSISGVGAFTKNGAGTLTLTGNKTYSGATTISAGTLQAGSPTAFSPNSAFMANSVLNLNGSSNTVGSLAGNGTVTNNGESPATLTVGGNNSSTALRGNLSDGSSRLGLTKIGVGTMIVIGGNTYTGGTTITAGAWQIGNDGTTGSLVGNVVDNGALIFNRSNTLTFGGVVSGTGSVQQDGSGTTILSGTNTYSGGTVLNAGTLTINGARALGLGDVVVNGGTLNADPEPINVKGNYTQNAGSTLQLQVAGANLGQYDSLKVGGNATLGGTLQLISLGFRPKAGNQLTLITTGGVVSGRFAQFVDPFVTGPGFSIVDLVYGRNSVLLEFLNFASFALTPNELAAANLLDAAHLDPRAANLISFLDKEPFANLPGDFEQISPEGLTAFYEISFSNANIQRLTLEGRLDDIHNGSNGFSSNMKLNGATVNLEDKAGEGGESSKEVVEPILRPGAQNRWGVWVTGFGDFVNVDGDGNANGYDFTTGGVSLGIDYRITDQLAIGMMGEYSHTRTDLKPSGLIDVDSGRGGLYATWFRHGIYLNGAIYGGHNSYDSSRSSLGGLATGGTEGAEWSTFVSGGYDFHFGHLSVGPIAALQYTYENIDGFSENGSLAALQIASQSADSLRTDLGLRVLCLWQIGKISVKPSLRAAWEHEFKYSALPITAGFAGIAGPSATFYGPSEGHDSAVLSAGVSAELTPAISTYVNYDGQLGRQHYDSNAVTGGVRISF